MNDIISGSYWTQAYCEKEKLDYEMCWCVFYSVK